MQALKVLSEEQFTAWWDSIDPEDRNDFMWSNGGDILLARFVCAIDLLLLAGGRKDGRKGTEVEAYALAFEAPLEEAKKKYRKALSHDAVVGLMERLGFRERALSWIPIEQKYARLTNLLVDEACTIMDAGGPSTKEQIETLKAALKGAVDFQKGVKADALEERTRRSKRALDRGRTAAMKSVVVTADDAADILRLVKDKLGPEGFATVLVGLSEPTQKALPQ